MYNANATERLLSLHRTGSSGEIRTCIQEESANVNATIKLLGRTALNYRPLYLTETDRECPIDLRNELEMYRQMRKADMNRFQLKRYMELRNSKYIQQYRQQNIRPLPPFGLPVFFFFILCNKNIESLKELLKLGVEIHTINSQGHTIWEECLYYRIDFKTIAFLVKKGAHLSSKKRLSREAYIEAGKEVLPSETMNLLLKVVEDC